MGREDFRHQASGYTSGCGIFLLYRCSEIRWVLNLRWSCLSFLSIDCIKTVFPFVAPFQSSFLKFRAFNSSFQQTGLTPKLLSICLHKFLTQGNIKISSIGPRLKKMELSPPSLWERMIHIRHAILDLNVYLTYANFSTVSSWIRKSVCISKVLLFSDWQALSVSNPKQFQGQSPKDKTVQDVCDGACTPSRWLLLLSLLPEPVIRMHGSTEHAQP